MQYPYKIQTLYCDLLRIALMGVPSRFRILSWFEKLPDWTLGSANCVTNHVRFYFYTSTRANVIAHKLKTDVSVIKLHGIYGFNMNTILFVIPVPGFIRQKRKSQLAKEPLRSTRDPVTRYGRTIL